jgi:hypothetical protein
VRISVGGKIPNATQRTPPKSCATKRITTATTASSQPLKRGFRDDAAEGWAGEFPEGSGVEGVRASFLVSFIIIFRFSVVVNFDKVKHFSAKVVLFNLICVNLSDYILLQATETNAAARSDKTKPKETLQAQ